MDALAGTHRRAEAAEHWDDAAGFGILKGDLGRTSAARIGRDVIIRRATVSGRPVWIRSRRKERVARCVTMLKWTRDLLAWQLLDELGEMSAERLKWEVTRTACMGLDSAAESHH